MKSLNLASRIRRTISEKIACGEGVIVEFLVHEILSELPKIKGPDAPFYRVCAYEHVRDLVKRSVERYATAAGGGFTRLEVAYTVLRGGFVSLVPLDQITDGELQARSDEYDTMASGCRAHAREIRAYVDARKPQEPTATT